jgi:transcription antitermination factor NusA-like protein
MKIIDLLNKIAKGEEVPKKIKYRNDIYILIDNYCYYCDETNLNLSDGLYAEQSRLNDEVEIIEELEEKKIPEKLDLYEETQNIIRENNYKLVYHDIHKCIVSLECKYNQLIDYLKSKGE